MITAVDSSILFDIIKKDSQFHEVSLQALREARTLGSLIVCPVVWAEVSSFYTEKQWMRTLFTEAGISFNPFDETASELAGKIWREYRQQGGKREHLIVDFLVAAHAQINSGRLLTRDRGFFRRYFRGLEIIEPKLQNHS